MKTSRNFAKRNGASRQQETRYFTLETTGFAYLNKVSFPKEDMVCVNLTALSGRSDDPEKRYISAIVRGDELQELIESHAEEINDKDVKVTCRFKLSDISATAYETREGDLAVSLNGYLYCLLWLKVNGDIVYSTEEQDDAQPAPRQSRNRDEEKDDSSAPSRVNNRRNQRQDYAPSPRRQTRQNITRSAQHAH